VDIRCPELKAKLRRRRTMTFAAFAAVLGLGAHGVSRLKLSPPVGRAATEA
jgi:hypothetical protein